MAVVCYIFDDFRHIYFENYSKEADIFAVVESYDSNGGPDVARARKRNDKNRFVHEPFLNHVDYRHFRYHLDLHYATNMVLYLIIYIQTTYIYI